MWVINFYCESSVVLKSPGYFCSGVKVIKATVNKEWCWMESPLPGLKLHLESHRVLLVGALILCHFYEWLTRSRSPGQHYCSLCRCLQGSLMLRMIRICFNRIWTTFWRKSVRNCQNFHVKKCKIMALTEKKHLYISSFTLNSYRLDEVKEFKDLGVITNEYL